MTASVGYSKMRFSRNQSENFSSLWKIVKKFCEIELFDFASFFGLDFKDHQIRQKFGKKEYSDVGTVVIRRHENKSKVTWQLHSFH